MLHPVRAAVGDRLVVRPGHPERPIAVMRLIDGEWRPIRVGPPNYGALILREDDGIIRQRLSAAVPPAAHPLVRQTA